MCVLNLPTECTTKWLVEALAILMGLKSMDKMEIDLSLSQEIGATFLEACNT
jgi:hypothetical protein